MNWGDEMPHPAAILLFIALIFPVALWFERRDRKRVQREADELRQLALEHEQEIAEMQAALMEHDWVDAMIENAFRVELKRQQIAMERIYRDAGIPMPDTFVSRVVESTHGIFVRAHCEAEAAEIVSQSEAFIRRDAA
jgi:hypothetical protein